MDVRQQAIRAFQKRFGGQPEYVARAPGRVNLLGEHVDYNDGFVLPIAIDRATWIAFRRTPAYMSTLLALDLDQETSFTRPSSESRKTAEGANLPTWAHYPAGVMWSLAEAGLETPAMEAVYCSDVPRGAGLSSSASVEVSFASAWQALGGWQKEPMQLALLSQKAENQYVGVNSGIMDQFASACGVRNRALCLDCRSLQWIEVALPADIAIVIANTNVRRALTGSGYNDRRAACQEAVRILQGQMPEIKSLRDVDLDSFNRLADLLPPVVEKRARHIVEEIARTAAGVQYLLSGEVVRFGKLMDQCHVSLRDLYEVSCPELDTMVEIAHSLPGCLGARLTGAGFGGCTVNLVAQAAVEPFTTVLAREYRSRTGIRPEIYVCKASAGASVERL